MAICTNQSIYSSSLLPNIPERQHILNPYPTQASLLNDEDQLKNFMDNIQYRHSVPTFKSSGLLTPSNVSTPSYYYEKRSNMELTMLQNLEIKFEKAIVPKNKLSCPTYVMQLTWSNPMNWKMKYTWQIIRPYKDFYELKEKLLEILCHGHFCHANCPWLYMYITHQFPRRHFFRGRRPSVITNRLTSLGVFFTTILNVLRQTAKEHRGRYPTQECHIVSQLVPECLYTFLFPEEKVHEINQLIEESNQVDLDLGRRPGTSKSMFVQKSKSADALLSGNHKNSAYEGRTPTNRMRRKSIATDGITRASSLDEKRRSICPICNAPLMLLRNSFVRDSDATMSLTSSESYDFEISSLEDKLKSISSCVSSITTLTCGHRFHDECILEKLNEKLACPTCLEFENTLKAS